MIHGRWKLKRNSRKLKIKFCDGSSFSKIGKVPFDFNKALYMNEKFTEFYDNKYDSTWDGESKYLRVTLNNQVIDTSILLGNWKITHIQRGKRKKIYKGSWYYKFSTDTSCVIEKQIGSWMLSNTDEVSDEVIIREKWDPYHVNYYIEQVENNNFFVFIGLDKKKVEIIYLERIE